MNPLVKRQEAKPNGKMKGLPKISKFLPPKRKLGEEVVGSEGSEHSEQVSRTLFVAFTLWFVVARVGSALLDDMENMEEVVGDDDDVLDDDVLDDDVLEDVFACLCCLCMLQMP